MPNVIGKPTTRLDGRLKVTGAARYTADINLPGMLYGRMLTSAHPLRDRSSSQRSFRRS